jgi:hypothetical protein
MNWQRGLRRLYAVVCVLWGLFAIAVPWLIIERWQLNECLSFVMLQAYSDATAITDPAVAPQPIVPPWMPASPAGPLPSVPPRDIFREMVRRNLMTVDEATPQLAGLIISEGTKECFTRRRKFLASVREDWLLIAAIAIIPLVALYALLYLTFAPIRWVARLYLALCVVWCVFALALPGVLEWRGYEACLAFVRGEPITSLGFLQGESYVEAEMSGVSSRTDCHAKWRQFRLYAPEGWPWIAGLAFVPPVALYALLCVILKPLLWVGRGFRRAP